MTRTTTMTMTTRPSITAFSLGAACLMAACVQEQNLSDPQSLMSASDSGGSDESTGDVDDSATSTTGQAPGCASNDGTLSSLDVHIGPGQSPMLYGISDVAIHPSGAIDIAFIQGEHIWAQIDAAGMVSFGDPPGTLSHVGYVNAAADGRRLVGLEGWTASDAGDWLQMIAADGTIAWNAAVFEGGAYQNIPDEHLMLADGGALVHVFWVDDALHSRLIHFDSGGTVTAADQNDSSDEALVDISLRDLVQAPNGDVWALRQSGEVGRLDRYAAGTFDTPAQSIEIPNRWVDQLRLDSEGRIVLLSGDPNYNQPFEPTTVRLEIRSAADGSVVAGLSNQDTEDFESPTAIATGPCGEIFVAGSIGFDYTGWVARVDEGGVLWSDTLDAQGAMFADVSQNGTLVVVGQTGVEVPDNVITATIAPYVARYEP